jgi:hypothetical protein
MKSTIEHTAVASLLVGLGFSSCLQDAVIARPRDGGSDAAARSPLRVEGELIASFERDEGEPEAEVRCSLRLTLAGEPVSDARVTLESDSGALELTENNGQFSGSQTGYFARYTLVVRARATEFRAAFSALAPHRIEAPIDGVTLRASAPLSVRWSPSGAPEATIEAARYAETPIADTGAYTIPAAALVGEAGRVTEERARIRRAQSIPLSEFADASRLRVIVVRGARFSLDAR